MVVLTVCINAIVQYLYLATSHSHIHLHFHRISDDAMQSVKNRLFSAWLYHWSHSPHSHITLPPSNHIQSWCFLSSTSVRHYVDFDAMPCHTSFDVLTSKKCWNIFIFGNCMPLNLSRMCNFRMFNQSMFKFNVKFSWILFKFALKSMRWIKWEAIKMCWFHDDCMTREKRWHLPVIQIDLAVFVVDNLCRVDPYSNHFVDVGHWLWSSFVNKRSSKRTYCMWNRGS